MLRQFGDRERIRRIPVAHLRFGRGSESDCSLCQSNSRRRFQMQRTSGPLRSSMVLWAKRKKGGLRNGTNTYPTLIPFTGNKNRRSEPDAAPALSDSSRDRTRQKVNKRSGDFATV